MNLFEDEDHDDDFPRLRVPDSYGMWRVKTVPSTSKTTRYREFLDGLDKRDLESQLNNSDVKALEESVAEVTIHIAQQTDVFTLLAGSKIPHLLIFQMFVYICGLRCMCLRPSDFYRDFRGE